MLIVIISHVQCAEIQYIIHQLSMCDVQFKVVNNIQNLLSLILDIIYTVTRSQFIKVCVHYSGYVTQNYYVSSRVLKKKTAILVAILFFVTLGIQHIQIM